MLPEDAWPPGQVLQTLANLFENSRVTFGSCCQLTRWTVHETLHRMHRAAAALAPRSCVNFALLLSAVEMRQRGRCAGRAATDKAHKNDGSVDDDDGNVYDDDERLCRRLGSDEPHACSVTCFHHAELLADERTISRSLNAYNNTERLVLQALLLFDPDPKPSSSADADTNAHAYHGA